MAECTRCGGFVTDDYVRVFADNEGNISSCRSCRAGSRSAEDDTEETDERVVLLRDVAGGDTTEGENENEREGTDPLAAEPESESSDESMSTVASTEVSESEPDEGSGGARERIAGLLSSIRG